jgi:hypothetical protein
MITNVLTMSLSPAGRGARAVDRDDIGKERKSEKDNSTLTYIFDKYPVNLCVYAFDIAKKYLVQRNKLPGDNLLAC